jgi:hypothetical protein
MHSSVEELASLLDDLSPQNAFNLRGTPITSKMLSERLHPPPPAFKRNRERCDLIDAAAAVEGLLAAALGDGVGPQRLVLEESSQESSQGCDDIAAAAPAEGCEEKPGIDWMCRAILHKNKMPRLLMDGSVVYCGAADKACPEGLGDKLSSQPIDGVSSRTNVTSCDASACVSSSGMRPYLCHE